MLYAPKLLTIVKFIGPLYWAFLTGEFYSEVCYVIIV